MDKGNETISAFANKAASRPGKFGTPFIGNAKNQRRRIQSPTAKPAPQKDISLTATSTSTPATASSDDTLPPQDAPAGVIRKALITRNACFYHAYGLSCPHSPCKYLHETSNIPYAWYRKVAPKNISLATVAAFCDTEDAYGKQDNFAE